MHHVPLFAEEDGLSFKDFLDILNPLQHIPLVNTIYRKATGDRPGALSRIIGEHFLSAVGVDVNGDAASEGSEKTRLAVEPSSALESGVEANLNDAPALAD